MNMDDYVYNGITDRLEGWELVEFLQVPIKSVLDAAIDNDWITEDNVEDLLEFAGIKQ